MKIKTISEKTVKTVANIAVNTQHINPKEDWQTGISQLKNGGLLGKIFGSFSEGAVGTATNQVNTVKYIAENPLGFSEGMIYSRLEAIAKNPLLIDPFRNSVYSEYSAFAEKKKKDGFWNALSNEAGAGCFLIAEAGVSSYASKALFTKFKTPMGGKNSLLDEPSINKNNFKINKNAKPATNKFINNSKDTLSGI